LALFGQLTGLLSTVAVGHAADTILLGHGSVKRLRTAIARLAGVEAYPLRLVVVDLFAVALCLVVEWTKGPSSLTIDHFSTDATRVRVGVLHRRFVTQGCGRRQMWSRPSSTIY
jgi:hypothetical protein